MPRYKYVKRVEHTPAISWKRMPLNGNVPRHLVGAADLAQLVLLPFPDRWHQSERDLSHFLASFLWYRV
jgi:hypothetical protein